MSNDKPDRYEPDAEDREARTEEILDRARRRTRARRLRASELKTPDADSEVGAPTLNRKR